MKNKGPSLIAHIDMDAFFVSIGQRDKRSLKFTQIYLLLTNI